MIYKHLLLLLFSSLIFYSCSSTKRSTVSQSGRESVYPGWYSTSGEFTATNDTFMAYGMAIASDTTVAMEKAISQAESNLVHHISFLLESVRSDAVTELGSESGLDSPKFIFALRKAENAISDVASVTHQAARQHARFKSYYGFAEVSASRQSLIEKLDNTFTANEGAWQTLKASNAFQEFYLDLKDEE